MSRSRAIPLSVLLLLAASLGVVLLPLGGAGARRESAFEEALDQDATLVPPPSRVESATYVLRDHAAGEGSDPAHAA